MKPFIHIKRIYESPKDSDGYRILIDRLWPRGLKKENLYIDKWAKDLAPSPALRNWFTHDPEKWQVFREKYEGELQTNNAIEDAIKLIKNRRIVTLLYAAHNEEHNHAVVLLDFLKKEIEFE